MGHTGCRSLGWWRRWLLLGRRDTCAREQDQTQLEQHRTGALHELPPRIEIEKAPLILSGLYSKSQSDEIRCFGLGKILGSGLVPSRAASFPSGRLLRSLELGAREAGFFEWAAPESRELRNWNRGMLAALSSFPSINPDVVVGLTRNPKRTGRDSRFRLSL